MLLQLQKHNGPLEGIEVLRAASAREIASSVDWDVEHRRFEQLFEAQADCWLPSIAFSNDAGRTLEFGPNSDDTFWLSYRYSIMKSTFCFYPTDCSLEQQLETCDLETALGLVEQHYRGEHFEIVAALPTPQDPDHESDGSAESA
jgi:hypothetical protein